MLRSPQTHPPPHPGVTDPKGCLTPPSPPPPPSPLQSHERKKNIFGFSGLVYEGDAKAERAKVAERLGKWTTPALQTLIDTLDMPRPSEVR